MENVGLLQAQEYPCLAAGRYGTSEVTAINDDGSQDNNNYKVDGEDKYDYVNPQQANGDLPHTPLPTLLVESDMSLDGGDDDTRELIPKEERTDPPMSKKRRIFLICLICFPQFVGAVQFSMIASFYPQTAKDRGANSILIGLVIGSLELGVVLAAPVLGFLISKTGIKAMYVTGIFVYGLFGLAFGFLQYVPSLTTFVILCIGIRLIMGFAAAAFLTTTLALAVHFFPSRLASVTGLLKICGGAGMVLGPLLGGYLYSIGGFILPFSVTQGILLLFGFTVIFILPKVENEGERDMSAKMCGRNLQLMCCIPILVICASFQVTINLVLSSADTCLALFLTQFARLTPVQIGACFLVAPACYIATTPLWGWISDKKPKSAPIIVIVLMSFAAVSLFFMGPSPLTGIPSTLWIVLVSLGGYGLSSSSTNVAIALMFKSSKERGIKDGDGLISSLVTCCASMGSLFGAIISGLLYDKLHFGWISTGYCFMYSIQVIVFIIIIVAQEKCCKKPPSTEDQNQS